ncbi:glycerophosphoryl diester phosphodiesterase membrane domain-containing protein [Aerococcaceae bacterium NML201209]|nr:glycerophosphoryl diester phosphodiesterase membrane domain-containing protein [Aerococcaceae bacterium NML201209]
MKKRNQIAYYGRIAWLYTKYQLLTKSILALIVFPIFRLVLDYLLQSTGRANISSGDYLSFLLSIQGVGFLLAALVVLVVLIAVDVNAFIIMSALIYEQRVKMTAKTMLIVALKSLRNFMKPSGILVMLYIALVVPLVGVGVGVSATKNFEIPNFITDVIFKNSLYTSLYVGVLVLLTVITVRYIFFFHYLLIENQSVIHSLKNAAGLMKRHWKKFIVEFFGKLTLLLVGLTIITLVIIVLVVSPIQVVSDEFMRRSFTIFSLMTVGEIIAYVTLMSVPIICSRLTRLFYEFNREEGVEVRVRFVANAQELGEESFAKIRLRTKLALSAFVTAVLAFNLLMSVVLGLYFNEIFRVNRPIDIVAHRGGGDLAAENSILGLQRAIEEGARWSEIDVQRTKDGHYIINHDATFKRVSDVDQSSSELTLAEIEQLKVKDLFNANGTAEKVATLDEFLDASKGKIGLFIELKGSTADEQMVDDVVEMVKAKNMQKEVALLSLDYGLIQYVEANYPEMDTGFLYFFSIGDTKSMVGDILIMEEAEATPDKVSEIKDAGKKAIVWTVNKEESIDKFVNSDVDGIITDYVVKVKEGIVRRDNRSDIEIILDNVMDR